ncbi:hypothetical protein GDO81_010029 [Engystomops pustulosus]|uniref:Secreted protein n=1 Tax=Engystomops pustulosus TaxID=76066 RepID=A0AAV7BX86_ENGPU|nr:hypothetical protein GDO81_010029 [Engystomops pustulosus]
MYVSIFFLVDILIFFCAMSQKMYVRWRHTTCLPLTLSQQVGMMSPFIYHHYPAYLPVTWSDPREGT